MKPVAIRTNNLGKQYILKNNRPMLIQQLMGTVKKERFWALRNIRLRINQGEQVGVIGNNGAGKTTLLKLISGITQPTVGSIKVKGKVAALLNLGAGFHPELSGRENTLLNGMLMGMTVEEVKTKMEAIVAFAGIGKLFDSPFFTYSSGMKLRLAFSIAINSNFDILLMDDETIFAGDKSFQKQIRHKIKQLRQQHKTVVIVSHVLAFLRFMTNRIILLDKGRVYRDGKPPAVIDEYKRHWR